jgi:hypothetical protein
MTGKDGVNRKENKMTPTVLKRSSYLAPTFLSCQLAKAGCTCYTQSSNPVDTRSNGLLDILKNSATFFFQTALGTKVHPLEEY